ncbi:Nuclear receptor coactivator 5 [Orchesella cincta]|uniref:Nuclear receptor coactivator 5 n=1 Tax=Orchesella cincta TaxID=48709 RepID=A0A1D2MAQ7_ORCCI|nr:Nuclear receptor coactivator 5 [Orchesella cincta]
MPPGPGYMPDYEPSPMMQRGTPYGESGGFGRGYSGNSPHTPPRPARGPGNIQPHMVGQGSASGIESGSNSDDPRSAAAGEKSLYANDCEIIVFQKAQQQYGEMVEKQLKDVGLTVDIMFPKADVNVTEFLSPLAKKGLIFAILIQPENEMARNINFYQFRGTPKSQLNKNVPLQMAIGLIKKKYVELQEKEVGRVPETMKALLSRVINEEFLSNIEYSTIAKFINERRNRQNSFLNRTSNANQEPKTETDSLLESEEGKTMQQRIIAFIKENNRPEDGSSKNP